MKLKVYLAIKDMTIKALAESVDISPVYLSRINKGRIHPGRKLLRKLNEVTNGEVDFPQRVIRN